MRIDYSINPYSKYLLFADVSFRQGANHLELALGGGQLGLSLAERVKHLAIGILKLIPVIGHVIALVDTLCQKKSITYLKLTSKDPFKRGEEHGKILKERIKEVYDPILKMKGKDPILLACVTQFEKQIPAYLIEEMKGLAKGSGYSYEDVLLIHTFLDADPGQFGCTSMAIKEDMRIAAANHRLTETIYDGESHSRQQAFLNHPPNTSIKKVLKAAGKDTTIQAMMFDTNKGEIHLSSNGSYASSTKLKKLEPDTIFDSHHFSKTDSDKPVKLYRNLDWPWYFLGQETVVITRPHAHGNSTVTIAWPGYIGTLSGMNSKGLVLTANQCNSEINTQGVPNPLLFTAILDNCKNVEEANEIIELGLHGSSINLMVADKRSAKSFELKGNGYLWCVGNL